MPLRNARGLLGSEVRVGLGALAVWAFLVLPLEIELFRITSDAVGSLAGWLIGMVVVGILNVVIYLMYMTILGIVRKGH